MVHVKVFVRRSDDSLGCPSPACTDDLDVPFLSSSRQQWARDDVGLRCRCARSIQVLGQLLRLAGPLGVSLVLASTASLINLLFVAQCGTQHLAAAALGNNIAVMLGRLVLVGLCGALDTLAAQACGAGKACRLAGLLQRTVAFLWLHCAALSVLILALPSALQAAGQDAELAAMVRKYLLLLLPTIWLEAVSRPVSRVLVARGVTTPQMAISMVSLPLAIAANYWFVIVCRFGYLGAAAALSVASAAELLMLLLYVAWSRSWLLVIGIPGRRAFRRWNELARLAYPSASMKCAESWAFTLMTLAASLLPKAYIATAAIGVAYNIYGVLFIAFVAFSTATCVTVGNRLGAGDPAGAKSAAAASLLIVPVAWGAAALVLLLPASQNFLILLFTSSDPVSGAPFALEELLRQLFAIVALLVLLDGIQTILSGVIMGCGAQRCGAVVNFAAFYLCAVPLSLWLAFQQGLGAAGLYLGMAAGPAIQLAAYTTILLRTNWEQQSETAVMHVLKHGSSVQSLVKLLDPGSVASSPLARGPYIRTSSFFGHPVLAQLPSIVEGRESLDGLAALAAALEVPAERDQAEQAPHVAADVCGDRGMGAACSDSDSGTGA